MSDKTIRMVRALRESEGGSEYPEWRRLELGPAPRPVQSDLEQRARRIAESVKDFPVGVRPLKGGAMVTVKGRF